MVNAGSWGVYRARYDEELRGRLYRSLDQLGDPERLSLVADTWAATVAGLVPLETSLELWSLLADERDPDVWWAVSGGLGLIELVAGPQELPLLQRLVRHLADGPFREVGWEGAAAGEGAGEAPAGRGCALACSASWASSAPTPGWARGPASSSPRPTPAEPPWLPTWPRRWRR